jgi:PKD repeat protein
MVASSVAMCSPGNAEKRMDDLPSFSTTDVVYAETPVLGSYGNDDEIIWNLIITPSEISAEVKEHQSIAQVITIRNIGDETMQIMSIEPDVNWTYVMLPPLIPESLEPQNSASFIVFEDAKNLLGGYHTATLSVKTNMGTENVSINLSVEPWSPVIDVNQNFATSGMLYGQKSPVKFTLTNPCNESLIVNLSSDSSWMEIKNGKDVIKPYSGKQIEVMLNGLFLGGRIGNISISSKNETWEIPIGVFVSDETSVMESSCGIVEIVEYNGSLGVSGEKIWHDFSVPSGLDQLVFINNELTGKLKFYLYDPDGNLIYSDLYDGYTTINYPKAGTWKACVYASSPGSYEVKMHPSGSPLEIVFTPAYWDAGKIQEQEVKSQNFTMKNVGETPIKLENGTTNVSWIEIKGDFNQTLLPDNTISFAVNVSPQGLPAARYEGFITIETDHGSYISQISMEARRPNVVIVPPSINIAPIHRNESLYFTFNIINTGNSELTINDASSTDEWITIEELDKNIVTSGGVSNLKIKALHSKMGLHSGSVHIHTNTGDYQIPVSVVVERIIPGAPVADAGPDQRVEVGETVQFDGSNSYDPDGFIVKYEWDFGNRSNGTEVAPTHVYTANGTYIVRLTVTDNSSISDTDICVIQVGNRLPVADTGPDQSVNVGETVQFDGSDSYDHDGSIVEYEWDFGDETTGTGVAPAHNYTAKANCIVTLTVTDDEGATDTDTCIIHVGNYLPVVDAGPDQRAEVGETVQFDGSDSYDPDGFIAKYEWDFGDGRSGAGIAPTHAYTANGTYTVTLTVTDNASAEDVDACSIQVIIDNVPICISPENDLNPSIAMKDGNTYAVWQRGGDIHFARLTDRKETWECHEPIGKGSAPSIAVDQNGYIYVVWGSAGTIYISNSTDSGSTFSTPVKVGGGYYPDLAVDSNGYLYVVWQNKIGSTKYTSVDFAKSEDKGATWSSTPVGTTTANYYSPPKVSVSPSGNNVYVVWVCPSSFGQYIRVYFSGSTDGGITFSKRKNPTGFTRHGEYNPDIVACDENEVYIAWRLDIDHNNHVYFTKSTDSGASFSPRIRVNDGAYSTTDAYLPSIAVDDMGIIHIAWKGTRGIYFDKSTDDGSSFGVDIRIDNTTDSSYQTDPSIAVGDHGRVAIAWEDNRNGNYDIYCAGITTTPAGDLNHDNQITPADTAIALQIAATGAQNPAADMNDDGRITSLDALMILQAAAGAISL